METRTLEPILKEHPFFQGLDPKYVQLLVGCATNAVFNRGVHIARSNDEANHFYILRSGKVAIELESPERGAMTIQTLGGNDILGWSWTFPPYKWNFDVRAIEQTRAIAFDGKCVRQKFEADHDLGYEMMKRFSVMLVDRLKATRLQVLDLYATPKGTKR